MLTHRYIIKSIKGGVLPLGYIPQGGYLGDIIPKGYIELKGQSFEEIKEYPELVELLKERYSCVPDLRNRMSITEDGGE